MFQRLNQHRSHGPIFAFNFARCERALMSSTSFSQVVLDVNRVPNVSINCKAIFRNVTEKLCLHVASASTVASSFVLSQWWRWRTRREWLQTHSLRQRLTQYKTWRNGWRRRYVLTSLNYPSLIFPKISTSSDKMKGLWSVRRIVERLCSIGIM